jgi:carboxypeptidase Q
MLESDDGVLRPSGFGFTGSDHARARIKDIASLLRGIQIDRLGSPGEGADIGPSVQAANIPSMSLTGDGNYFLLHHTPADTIDKIDAMDMSRAAAAIAVIAYVVAEMPERLK